MNWDVFSWEHRWELPYLPFPLQVSCGSSGFVNQFANKSRPLSTVLKEWGKKNESLSMMAYCAAVPG